MKLDKISFTSGAIIHVSRTVTAVVGPNNAGKSTVLRELKQAFDRHAYQGPIEEFKIINGYGMGREAGVEALIQEISESYPLRPAGQHPEGFFQEPTWRFANGVTLASAQVAQLWSSDLGLGSLASYFCTLLDATSRLNIANTTASYNAVSESPSQPVQRLYADRNLESALSLLTVRAFGVPVTVNRYAGSQIMVHVGAPTTPESVAPQTEDYLRELAALPLIDEQGDGFKAFVGIVLSVLAGAYPLVLIDEPEAFLHPPQARLLGQFLAEQHSNGRQVIVSTHSEDIVAGLTGARGSGTTLVRLTRDGAINSVAQLSAESVQNLYEDPLMRYYDMLNGLFVRGVIVCEADSDCTYYRAVLEELDKADGADSGLHFSHTGGKARVHVAVDAFKQSRVPVAAILDIDFLQNDNEFSRLVSAAGGDPSSFIRNRNVVVSAVQDRNQNQSVVAARAEILAHLDTVTGNVTSALVSKINDSIKGRSGWKEFKRQGKRMLSGEALSAYNNLDHDLKTLGIFMVPEGELERFHPLVSASNKAHWLRQVLESEAYKTATEAKTFLQEVRVFATQQQTA